MVQEVHLLSTQDTLWDAISKLQQRSNSLTKVTERLALGLRKGYSAPQDPVTAREREAALRLIYFHAQAEVRKKMAEGKYSGLSAWVSKAEFRGLWVTRGRIPAASWRQLTGKEYLPILPGSSWLAKAIIIQEHQRDHRKEVGALLAATRR